MLRSPQLLQPPITEPYDVVVWEERVGNGPPYPDSPLKGMADEDWELFATLPDQGSAQVLATKLESEGIATSITPVTIENARDGKFQVYVEAGLAHRARWIMNQSDFSDSELEFLAMGKLPEDEK